MAPLDAWVCNPRLDTRAIANLLVALAYLLTGSGACADEIDSRVLAAQEQRTEVMRVAAEATVAIFGLEGGGGGSGVIISPDGYALTNYHVSSACGNHMRCGLNDGRLYDAVIVGVDAVGDLSLIKLFGRDDFPFAPMADSNNVRLGDWCFAAGNPFVLASNLQPSISMGIISGVHRYQYPAGTLLEYADCLQTDAAINPGNSGGPLFNMAGEVIGINGRCSFEKRGRINVGVGYAISANQAKYFLNVLRSGRLVDHATLGATVSTESSGQVSVSNILTTVDAYRRGLRVGDEVLSLAGREVKTTNMFKNILGTLPKNWRVPLEIQRNGVKQTLLVRLGGVHTEKQLTDLVDPENPHGGPLPPSPQPRNDRDDSEPDENDQPLPDELKSLQPDYTWFSEHFQKRRGFANYYYNELHRKKAVELATQASDVRGTSDTWSLGGNISGESTPVRIQLNPSECELNIGSRSQTVDLSGFLSDTIGERRETGLLVGLLAWQQFLRLGPEGMGESSYLGRMPVYAGLDRKLENQPLLDVVQVLWQDTQTRFYTTETGEIRLIEVFGDDGTDPIEVYFDKYSQTEIKLGPDTRVTIGFPDRVRLQYGTETLLMIDLDLTDLGTRSEDSQ